MKKAAIFFVLLVFIFAPKQFFMANAAAWEWESRSENGGVYYDGETYLLKNETGDKNVFAAFVSEKITLHTKIELELELIEFSETILSDVLIIQLMAANENGLKLTLKNVKDEQQVTRTLKAEFYQNGQVTKTAMAGEIIGTGADRLSKKILIKIEFKDNIYNISFNFEKIELKAETTETKAEFSVQLISGDPPWAPEVKILKTDVDIKEQPANEENPRQNEDNQNQSGSGNEGEGGSSSNDLNKVNPNNDTLYQAIITVSASAFVGGLVFLIIRRRKRRFRD